jgi:hypothetical protein
MVPPPEWLVGWTQYVALVVGLIVALKGLIKGAKSLL